MRTIGTSPITPNQYGLRSAEFPRKIMRILVNMNGYHIAELEKKNSSRGSLIKMHEVVLYAYLTLPLGQFKQCTKLNIHHIDGDKSNNHIRNLILISRDDHNIIHTCDVLNRGHLKHIIVLKWKLYNWLTKHFYPIFSPERHCRDL